MRNFIKIVFIIALLTVGGGALFVHFTDKNALVLTDGTVKTVDQIWESGDSVFYEISNDIFVLSKKEIKSYGKRNLNHLLLSAQATIAKNIKSIETSTNSFLDPKHVSVDHDFLSPQTLLVLLLMLLVCWLSIRAFKKTPKVAEETQKTPVVAPEAKDEAPGRLDIVRFFLNLYKHQIGAEPDAPVEFVPLKSKTSGPNHIYELRVKHMDDWAKRRMTIGPLGEESGSKSKCYYVIYDVHMVVKIPVKPIADFEEYIESIKKEVHIVDKLAPKECIIPRVSVILGLIQNFPNSQDDTPERLEEKYINWLRRTPEYQEYLKINNSFIFFMDLSKYYFLGHILEELHDIRNSIAKEIAENAQIIWEPSKFKGRYGVENDAIFEVREVYNRCEAEMRRLVSKSGITTPIPNFQFQSWFFTHLAEKEVTRDSSNYPEKFIAELNGLLKKSMQENSDVVNVYRQTIKGYLHRSSFQRNKAQMAAIAVNLLDLLAWFRKKRVSMRDLKPDNLFVAGDPARYPLFLRSPEEFSLGIIDVETAVDFEKSKYKKTKQPLLGGTPYYATPSHFIKNDLITSTFNNLGKILHLQDWHAVLVMVYKVVTGELLFVQTARMFGEIRNMLISANKPENQDSKLFEEASQMFWHSAVVEFQLKLADSQTVLKTMMIPLPDTVIHMFGKVLVKERKTIAEAIQDCVGSQQLFEKEQIRELFLKSSHAKICQFKADLESKAKAGNNQTGPRTEAIMFLHKLADLKALFEQHTRTLKLVSQPDPKMSVHDILAFMFHVVLNNMYPKEWKPLFGEAVVACDEPAEETVIEATL